MHDSMLSIRGMIDILMDAEEQNAILVTGCAGFIGFHLSKYLTEAGFYVVGIDNLNSYYSTKLKEDRLKILKQNKSFQFYKTDICDYKSLRDLSKKFTFKQIVHLAAQAGVCYSIDNPFDYERNNISGFLNILELARNSLSLDRLVYASSSSVYGANDRVPFREEDRTDYPISFYAATKKANEVMAESYSRLYGIRMIGLRFFTVYGPYGRPDMAPLKFTDRIFKDKTIDLYNYGKMKRDFTYIDDIVKGIIGSLITPHDGHEIYNLGSNKSENISDFISILEKEIGKSAKLNLLPMQKGEVEVTFADTSKAESKLSYRPKTSIEDGIKKLVAWYKEYYIPNSK